MPAAAIVTLIATGLTIAALAVYLVTVAWQLRHVSFTLGTIIVGLRAIGNQTEPLGPVISEIRGDLEGLQATLEGLLRSKGVDVEEMQRVEHERTGLTP